MPHVQTRQDCQKTFPRIRPSRHNLHHHCWLGCTHLDPPRSPLPLLVKMCQDLQRHCWSGCHISKPAKISIAVVSWDAKHPNPPRSPKDLALGTQLNKAQLTLCNGSDQSALREKAINLINPLGSLLNQISLLHLTLEKPLVSNYQRLPGGILSGYHVQFQGIIPYFECGFTKHL
jgi:hypothetical protein